MKTIRKQISMDSLRNHECGILPYTNFNSGSAAIKEVSAGNENGNYGGFVCDFVFKNGEEYETIDTPSRLRYLDALSRYRDSKEIMESGILVKKYVFSGVTEDEKCPPTSSITKEEYWSPEFTLDLENYKTDCLEHLERFGAAAYDINDFEYRPDGTYVYTGTGTTPTDNYILLINYYGTFVDNDKWWNDWWEYWRQKDSFVGPLYKEWEKRYLVDKPTKYTNPPYECYRFIWDFERYVLGKIFVPERIKSGTTCVEITGSRVPKFVYYTNYGKYISLIDSEEKGSIRWTELGGNEFRTFLTGITPVWITVPVAPETGVYFTYSPAKTEVPILLTEEYSYETIYSPYEYSIAQNTVLLTPKIGAIFAGYTGGTMTPSINNIYAGLEATSTTATQAVKSGDLVSVVKAYDSATTFTLMGAETTLTPHFSTAATGHVESKIETLASQDAIYLGEGLYGCFQSFTDDKGQMIKCTYNGTEWEYATTAATGLRCADGEVVNPGYLVYRNATIAACIEGMTENPTSGDVYYILARYDNSQSKPFTFPFKVGEKCNVTSIDDTISIYDVVISTAKTGDKLIVEYATGIPDGTGFDPKKWGIQYEEEFKYESGSAYTYVDGVYKAKVYYEKASNEGLTKEIYNNELRLSRNVKQAKITGMEVGTTWTSNNAVSALLFAKEGMESLQEEPIYNVNIIFDRGLATAWESHFKISECNTLEDLTLYGNNYFNL